MRCIVCQSSSLSYLRKINSILKTKTIFSDKDLYICKECEHGQVIPLPILDDLKEYYLNNYRSENKHNDIDESTFPYDNLWYLSRGRSLRDFALKHINKDDINKVFELGAGFGYNLWAFKEMRPETNIFYEEWDESCWPFLERIKAAQEDKKSDSRYDLIILSHVLEHLLDPYGDLKGLSAKLKKGGSILIEVPHCPSDEVEWGEEPHLSYFSRRSLHTLLENAGFKVLAVETCGQTYRKSYPRYSKVISKIPLLYKLLVHLQSLILDFKSAKSRREYEAPRLIPVKSFCDYGNDNAIFLRALVKVS